MCSVSLLFIQTIFVSLESGSCLSNVSVELGLKGEAIRDCSAQVSDLVDGFEFILVDADERWHIHVLSHHLGLF